MQVSARTTLALGHPRIPKTNTVLYHAVPRWTPTMQFLDFSRKLAAYLEDIYNLSARWPPYRKRCLDDLNSFSRTCAINVSTVTNSPLPDVLVYSLHHALHVSTANQHLPCYLVKIVNARSASPQTLHDLHR